MSRPDNRVQFRRSKAITAFLERRGPADDAPSQAIRARDDLLALDALLAAELQDMPLATAEAAFLADVVNGRWPKPGRAGLYIECRRALHRPGLTAAAQPFDPTVLLAKLELLGPAADFAISEALAIWRARGLLPTAGGFRQAGLRIDDRGMRGTDGESQQVA